MQVLHSPLCSGGEELFTDHQPELGDFGCQQSHNEQGEQDGSQWNGRVIQQQFGFGEALLLKESHRVGKVLFMVLLPKRNSD